jgi:hypothetical protein
MNKFFIRIVFLFVFGFISSISFVSCKSKAVVVEKKPTENKIKAKNIIENYYNNKNEFSTLYIKANAQFSNEKQTQNVTAEIKIKKDEQILISIRFLGITMAKAMITPTTVSYYEKMGGTYYEGDFTALSQFLGTDLDFEKIQNMLIGRAIDDLKKGQYEESLTDGVYRLDSKPDNDIKKSFYFDSERFLINKQEITQVTKGRMIQVLYANKKEFSSMILPQTINIDTYQNQSKSELNLDYNTITVNEELSFPYSVPNGYKRIIIK